MEKIRSRKFARLTAIAAVTLTTLAACGGSDSSGGGFDVNAFADQMSKDGAMTKDQAKCIGDYINENGSDEVKSELAKAVKEGDDAAEPSEAVASEVADLMLAAGPECLTS